MQTQLVLYNTLSRTKEPFTPLDRPVKLYTCGPTVYNYAHIGNFRTYVFEDLLKRTLLFFGYAVHHVMNITDVDDKTIAGATLKGVPLGAYTEPYTQAFFEDLAALHLLRADAYPRATQYIPQMIEAIQVLLSKKIAYIGQDGSVYFSIQKFPKYGQLSHLCLNDLQCFSRISSDEYDKEHLSDFVLWKSFQQERDGAIYWESPFGRGRPGWHLECSVMSMELLGESIDIHAGGVDNIFPHHENEIAQSESLSYKPFVRFWMHSEHLLVEGKKMSKSSGNFYTLRDLLRRGFSGTEVRYLLLQSHYRSQLNFTETGLLASRQTLKRLKDFSVRISLPYSSEESVHKEVLASCDQFFLLFSQRLANDLNITEALGELFNWIHNINNFIDKAIFSQADADYVRSLLRRVNQVLGVLSLDTQEIPEEITQLARKREEARKTKNWHLADELRDLAKTQGFLIEDTKSGPVIKRL